MEAFGLLKLKKSRGSSLDDGPFFDLDFSPNQFKMSVSSPRHRLSSSSPFLSEEIFLNGRLFSLQSSSSEPNSMPQSTSRVRKVSKDVILRCISKLKPFYTKVSNLGFSGPSKNGFAEKQSHLKSATVLVPRRLRKSRSASSAVASVISRDDSLLQQEDGIQSAIAHCKRSFHADKAFGGAELQPMVRSMSDPGGERSGGSSADDFSVC